MLWSMGRAQEQAGEEAQERQLEMDSDAEEEHEDGMEADGPEAAA